MPNRKSTVPLCRGLLNCASVANGDEDPVSPLRPLLLLLLITMSSSTATPQ